LDQGGGQRPRHSRALGVMVATGLKKKGGDDGCRYFSVQQKEVQYVACKVTRKDGKYDRVYDESAMRMRW